MCESYLFFPFCHLSLQVECCEVQHSDCELIVYIYSVIELAVCFYSLEVDGGTYHTYVRIFPRPPRDSCIAPLFPFLLSILRPALVSSGELHADYYYLEGVNYLLALQLKPFLVFG